MSHRAWIGVNDTPRELLCLWDFSRVANLTAAVCEENDARSISSHRLTSLHSRDIQVILMVLDTLTGSLLMSIS